MWYSLSGNAQHLVVLCSKGRCAGVGAAGESHLSARGNATERQTMQEEHWHLDRRVPIALIFAMIVQFIGLVSGGVWFAGKLDSKIDAVDARVTVVDRDMARLTRQLEAMADASQVQAIQLGRIEEQISGLRSDFSRLVTALEGLGGQGAR